jgi:hypothetical protein
VGNRSRYRPRRKSKGFFDGPRLGRHDGGEPEQGENFAPFGDVSFYGGPMPSEMKNGSRWYAERLHMINLRGAVPVVAVAVLFVLAVVVIGALLTG